MKKVIGYSIVALIYILLLTFIFLWTQGNGSALAGVYWAGILFMLVLIELVHNSLTKTKS